jgi:hypothetical protein
VIDDESSASERLNNHDKKNKKGDEKDHHNKTIVDENTKLLQKHVDMCNQINEYGSEANEGSYFDEELLESGSGNFDKLNQVVNLGD